MSSATRFTSKFRPHFIQRPQCSRLTGTNKTITRLDQSIQPRYQSGFAAPSTSVPAHTIDSFAASTPARRPESPQNDHKTPDERTLKLGKTLRTLQPLLPTLLQSPLPTSTLSPQISLHLFPSTHPHLPVVHGRVAYVAALWTSPLAWGRVPLIGNVKLEILSERMVRSPMVELPESDITGDAANHEQLVVRWRTIGKPTGTSLLSTATKLARGKKNGEGYMVETQGEDKEFTGLFIFAFDEEGRIVRHVIEHVQQHGNWEKGVGARVVGLTDWLLGRMKDPEPDVSPCCTRHN